MLWLGTSDAPLTLVTHLRSRGITLVARAAEADVTAPVARLMLVEAAVSPAARNASVKGRRVAVIHPDPGSADALAQALRGRGAQVVALSLNPEALERVEALDPDAVLMEVTDFYGSCWEIVRALWQHPRLKYAPVLLATPEGVASYAQGTPDVPSLCLAVQKVSEAYERAERSSQADDHFEAELSELGPARLLRVLTESQRSFRLSVSCPTADFEVDVSQGIIAGAQGSAKGAANDLYLGVHALALLMTQEHGQARARSADHPAATNVMAPLDAALHAAREAKAAAPQDAAATREVAARLSIPDAPPAQPAKASPAFEPARPSRAPIAKPAAGPKASVPKAAIESQKSAPASRELPVEPQAAIVVGSAKNAGAANVEPQAPLTPATREREPETIQPAPVEQAGVPPLAQPKKTLHGLPPPRRTTSTGRIMAVVPQERELPEGGARPAVHAPRPTTQPAVAQSVALGGATVSPALLHGDVQAALATDGTPTREFDCAVDAPGEEDSRVTARGHDRVAQAEASDHFDREDVLSEPPTVIRAREESPFVEPVLEREPAVPVTPLKSRLDGLARWKLWAGFGGLGAALGIVGVVLLSSSAPGTQKAAPAVPPLPSVSVPAVVPPSNTPSPQDAASAAKPTSVGSAAEAAEDDADPEAGDDDADEGAASDELPAPRQASALVSQGHNFRKRKLYTQARAKYQAALNLLPGYPRALAGLAQVAIAQNKGKDAVAFAQKLVQARPGQGAYQLMLGDAYKAANMPKEAQQAWQAAVRSGNATAKTRLKTTSAPSNNAPQAKAAAPAAKPAAPSTTKTGAAPSVR